MNRQLDIGMFYKMVSRVHTNLLDSSQWPSVRDMDDSFLDEISRACHGAQMALARFRRSVDDELERRGLDPFAMPLRLVPDPDPMKNKVEI